MPVRDPPEDAPEKIVELLEAIDAEFDHEHCLFFADAPFGGFGSPSTIWMYYPDRRENPELTPEDTTYLASITDLVESRHPSTYSHVSGMDEHDYPEDVPEGATDLSKISPKGV